MENHSNEEGSPKLQDTPSNIIENKEHVESLPNAIDSSEQKNVAINTVDNQKEALQKDALSNSVNNTEQKEEAEREVPLAVSVTPLDLNFFKDLTKTVSLYSIIGLIVGGVILVLYAVLLTFGKGNNFFFYLSILPLMLSSMLLVAFQIQKKVYKKGLLIRYEFYQDHILQRTLQYGALTAEATLFYKNIQNAKYKAVANKKGYLVFSYLTKYAKHYVNLQNMSKTELEHLQRLFSVQFPQNH